jgi:hypothetical protein
VFGDGAGLLPGGIGLLLAAQARQSGAQIDEALGQMLAILEPAGVVAGALTA